MLTIFFILLIFLNTVESSDEQCEAIHAQAHGINLVCCSLNNTLQSSCEFSSHCREKCSCLLTIGTNLQCNLSRTYQDYKWTDHHPNTAPLECSTPNLPNIGSPYSILVENSDPKMTYKFLIGLCSTNIISITFQHFDKLYEDFDLSECFPNLASFQVILLSRKHVSFTKLLSSLHSLTTLSLVNVDFEFWLKKSPFVKTLTYLHVENSTLSEIPKWMAECQKLSTVYFKNTLVASASTIAQLPAVRSLKLSNNAFNSIHRHVFVSSLLIHVDFSYNKISSLSSHTFGRSTDLRVLDLSSNPIQMLPYKPFARNPRLKWLKLSRTNITTLNPHNFYGLTSLKTLTLSHLPLESISPYAFVSLKALRYLDLDHCRLTRVPQAVIQNCHVARINVANNLLHRASAFPPEVMAMLSGLAQFRIEGNPLTEFPAAFLLISRENIRLLRHLLHTTMTLPVWVREPCTPYYWAMHLANRTTTQLRAFLAQYNSRSMRDRGLAYCREQYEWMLEQMDIYRDFEINSGCATQRRLRSSHITTESPMVASTSTHQPPCPSMNRKPTNTPNRLMLASLGANFFIIITLLAGLVAICISSM